MFQILAVETLPDGTLDLITPEMAREMRLPFDFGWEAWAIFQGQKRIFVSTSYQLVESTRAALSNSKH